VNTALDSVTVNYLWNRPRLAPVVFQDPLVIIDLYTYLCNVRIGLYVCV
jgi:hypothetical protein